MRKHTNSLLKKFGLNFPAIIQAPMAGGITTPKLVAAVSNKNALGSFATGYLTTEEVLFGIREIKKLTNRPFAVNIFIPEKVEYNQKQLDTYQHALSKFRRELEMEEEYSVTNLAQLNDNNFNEIIDILLNERIEIVSFAFGNLPNHIIHAFKKNGTYLIGTATSLEEANILAESKIDAIVAQGYEAGGHRGGFFTPIKRSCVGTMALIPQITKSIDLPIVAAGGIMDGRGIVAATALGAAAVQMGTAFLTTKESGAAAAFKEELIKAKESDSDITTLTAAYSGKIARGINTDFIDYIESRVTSIPPYPLANKLSTPLRKEATKKKAVNIMSMWSGQGVPLITNNLSADELIDKLHNEVNNCRIK